MEKVDKVVNLALIASGSGTDAAAIMKAYRGGEIPNVELKRLFSTKQDAGCLEKAEQYDIPSQAFHYYGKGGSYQLNEALRKALLEEGVELVFLVGCINKIQLISGMKFYNIHPADLQLSGGKGMYGLEPHKRVLLNIQDLVRRGRWPANDRFFTYPTVHEVIEEFDSGPELMRVGVEIEAAMIDVFLRGQINLDSAAKRLQEQVRSYEWKMLPWAVRLAADKILEIRK